MQNLRLGAKPSGNVIYVNFRDTGEEHPMIARLSRSEDPMEMTTAHYWKEKEYVKAARLAQELDDKEIRNAICNEGIMRLHRQIVQVNKAAPMENPSRLMSIAVSYNELAQLHGIKGNPGTAESYLHLSKAAWDRVSIAKLERQD